MDDDELIARLDPEQQVQFRALLRSLGVFRGTPAELTARGARHGVGDVPLERGYSAVLTEGRA